MIEVTVTEKLGDNLYRAKGGAYNLLVKQTGFEKVQLVLSDRYASSVGEKRVVYYQHSRPVRCLSLRIGTFLTFPNTWIYTTSYD